MKINWIVDINFERSISAIASYNSINEFQIHSKSNILEVSGKTIEKKDKVTKEGNLKDKKIVEPKSCTAETSHKLDSYSTLLTPSSISGRYFELIRNGSNKFQFTAVNSQLILAFCIIEQCGIKTVNLKNVRIKRLDCIVMFTATL